MITAGQREKNDVRPTDLGKYYTHHKGKKRNGEDIKQKKKRIENDMVKAQKEEAGGEKEKGRSRQGSCS